MRARPIAHALRQRARLAGGRCLAPAARWFGYDIVPSGFHSVVSRVDEVPEHVWARRTELRGIDFDARRHLEWAREELEPFLREFAERPPRGWSASNGFYDATDAAILYAMVRRRKPKRIVELGSGFSSRVMDAACRVNAAEGSPCALAVYDPYPRRELLEGLDVELRTVRAQDVPLDAFRDLSCGDVLVVDTSHTVKVGGDVNRIVLDVLPIVAPGVIVHFHDVFLPAEYPRGWVAIGWHWGEAYLVQAFLCLNPHFAVRFAAHAVWLDHREELRALVPTPVDDRPSAFWIERVKDV